jgi:hypothetical protein
MGKPDPPAPMSYGQHYEAQNRSQAQPARRLLSLSGRQVAVLVAEAILLVALLVGGTFVGLSGSARGFEAIGLAWLAMNLLVLHTKPIVLPTKPLGRIRAVGRGLAMLLVGGLLAAALVTAPGVHSPIPHAPKVAEVAGAAPKRVQARAAELAASCSEQKFPGSLGCAFRKWWADRNHSPTSPTTTTRPRKENT